MDQPKKKKIAILSVCSLILVAMVVALVIGGTENEDEETVPDVSSSQKAISSICETTDYQQTCMNSLAGHNSSNPKDLIEVAFQAAVNYINQAAINSSAFQKIETDPRAKAALQNCQELANRAIGDLQRSFAKFSNFDIINVDDILLDLKIWLSGAITHQETCLDGFEDVPGESGQKMQAALKTSMELTSNALAMVAEISTFLEAMGMQGFSGSRRRLLSEEDFLPVLGHGGDLPHWMDFNKRKLLTAPLKELKPDVVVAKDGSGKYMTINEALKDIPKKSNKTFVFYIKEGVYEEKVTINSSFTHVMMVGDGPTKTRITGKLNFIDGTGTYQTATVAVQGDDFMAKEIGFENSAGAEKHQAVALRVSADKAIFYNCHMDGYQDTLYVHTYRQFYRDCVISGTIDFIFGDSAAVFQGCTLVVRKPMENQQCIVTAQGRKDVRQPTGIVIQNCTFKADPEYYPFRDQMKSYLGRPWKEYSRTIIMESFLDDFIQPDGWLKWNDTFALETLFYTEFNNRGPAAPKMKRVKWPGVKELPPNRVERFTAGEFLDGNRWIPPTHVPYAAGFIFPAPKEDPNVKYSPVVPEENKDLGKKIDKTLLTAAIESSNKKDKDNSESPPTPPSGGSGGASGGGSNNPVPVPHPDTSTLIDLPVLIPQPVTEITQVYIPPPTPVSPPPPVTTIAAPPPVSIPESVITVPPSSSPTGSSTLIPDSNAAGAPQSGSNSQLDFAASAPITTFVPGNSDIAASSPFSSSGAAVTEGAASPISNPQLVIDPLSNPISPTISPTGSSSSIPQSNEAASPTIAPISSSVSNAGESNKATSPTISPISGSVSIPQSDAAASPPTSLTATSASAPQSGDAAASPPTSLTSTASSAPQSGDATASPPTSLTATSASTPQSGDAVASPPTSVTAISASAPQSGDVAASPPTLSATPATPPQSGDAAASPPTSLPATSASAPQSGDVAASLPTSLSAALASVPQSGDVAASLPSSLSATLDSVLQSGSGDVAASPPTSLSATLDSVLQSGDVAASLPTSLSATLDSVPQSGDVAASLPTSLSATLNSVLQSGD